MSKPIIEINNLSKKYKIGIKQPYFSLRDTVMGFVANPITPFKKKKINKEGLAEDEFWALKEVSLKIMPGESIGIIGFNGAGKTTLLKLISQITPPTLGEIILGGSVASLLEVGTGFHPELSGRENIYLNGAILGMTRSEINKKFIEIVNFAEIEKFLDTPVKRYSSGMYMRLAFAVASHLDSDILLIDEVLAVGDTVFQKKCLGKIEDITGKGRTILFVTHNLQAISRYCQKVALLDKGNLVKFASVGKVVNDYLDYRQKTATKRTWAKLSSSPGDNVVRLREVSLWEDLRPAKDSVDIRSTLRIDINYQVLTSGESLVPSIQLTNQQGIIVFSSNHSVEEWNWKKREKGTYLSSVYIPGNFLSDGNYILRVVIASYSPARKHISQRDVITFCVVDSSEGDTARGGYIGRIDGVVRPLLKWNTKLT